MRGPERGGLGRGGGWRLAGVEEREGANENLVGVFREAFATGDCPKTTCSCLLANKEDDKDKSKDVGEREDVATAIDLIDVTTGGDSESAEEGVGEKEEAVDEDTEEGEEEMGDRVAVHFHVRRSSLRCLWRIQAERRGREPVSAWWGRRC